MSYSIRERQIGALRSVLNLGAQVTKNIEPEWKVLIYDNAGQDIITPLFSVADLRNYGVTLYTSLHGQRDAVPDVSAVYFVLPTENNIKRICEDMNNGLYDSYYFNFISAISRKKLEDLASAAIHADVASNVMKIFDQYVNFTTLEHDLFELNSASDLSYYNFNKSNLKDHEMDEIINAIVDGLYCVFVTMGTIPIIRCPTGNAAEMVATKLDKKLRDNLKDARNSFFSLTNTMVEPGQQITNFQRPLLLIADRNIDLATPLHHTWTYQALVHDVLDMKLNKVIVTETVDDNAMARPMKTQSFNLGSTDKFWHQHRGNPFPQVAEAVQEEIEEYKSHEGEVQRLKAVMGLAESDQAVDISDNTAKLTSAMSSLPQLLEKKRLIDIHTTIATAVLGSIKERKLDEYFETEEKLMSKTTGEKPLIEFLRDSKGGSPEDKMRLFLIYYICQSQVNDLDELIRALEDSGCDIDALKYVKRWKQYTMVGDVGVRGGGTKTIGMFSHLMSTGSQFVMEGVKNLVLKKHKLPLTKILDNLMELKSNQEIDSYRYFDPKLARALDTSMGRAKAPYTDAVVFVVGGGNYIEYHNIMEYSRNKPGRRVAYGCSQLLNANQFLQQLCQLGKEIQ
uniref:Sec1 family domain-containing protein 1 n=1 Tax=Ciona intestinalis TaxID=7719 RepID=F6X3Q7_CIOIN|nr:sec1 family domain-containing protein 1 [Ciona intestinalis]|eukprot:XP_002121594.1 sec1 family domain-containing protein 1 [Ciona intestinalis]